MANFDFSGAPSLQTRVIDTLSIGNVPRGSVGMVMVRADRGEPSVAKKYNTESKFIEDYGKRNADSSVNDLLYARLMLKQGISLIVSRVVHYTDIADINTAEGTKSTATLTVTTDDVTWDAKYVGLGYDGITITTAAAASGTANKLDVTVVVPNVADPIVYTDLSDAPTAQEIADFNEATKYIELDTFTNAIPVGTATLAGAVQDMANIVTADYSGDNIAKTGVFAFDSVSESRRIINIRPVTAINKLMDAYILTRATRTTLQLGFPLGLSGDGHLDYVKGEGAYVTDAYKADNELVKYAAGELQITDPDDATKLIKTPASLWWFSKELIGDAINPVGYSPAALPLGQITYPNSGVTFDLSAGNNKADYWDELYKFGVNIVKNMEIPDTDGSIAVIDGNSTAKLDRRSLLSVNNIVNTVNWIELEFTKVFALQKNKPNIPNTWKETELILKAGAIATLINDRAIQPQENADWQYLGDQDVLRVADVQINDPERVPFGDYEAYFVFKPNGAMTQIGVGILPATEGNYDIIIRDLNQ